MLVEHAVDGGTGDAVIPSQLPQAVAAAAIAEDGIAIEFKRPAPDVAAFETGAPHAGAHPLDDKVALQFCNCPR